MVIQAANFLRLIVQTAEWWGRRSPRSEQTEHTKATISYVLVLKQ